VLLATAEDAGRAIDMLNGYEWQTRVLEVRVDRVGGVGHVVPSGPAPSLGGPGVGMGMGQFDQMGSGTMGGMGLGGLGNMNPNVGYSGSGAMYQGQMGSGVMGGMSGIPGGGMHQQNLDLGGQQSQYFMNQGVGMHAQGQGMMSAAPSPGIPGGPPGRTLFVGNVSHDDLVTDDELTWLVNSYRTMFNGRISRIYSAVYPQITPLCSITFKEALNRSTHKGIHTLQFRLP
jgi:hypothetical protein